METKQMMLRMPKELHTKLTEKAERMGVSVSHLIIMEVWDIIEREKEKKDD
jgi:predicted HicB family RNase H-like nuclease